MTFIEKINMKCADFYSVRPVTMAFIGDSVTHGCFELRRRMPTGFEAVYDYESVYHNVVRKIFAALYPRLALNIINAGINGDSAPSGLKRLERDVLSYKPDMTVVCYGLNDSGNGIDGITLYTDALKGIFEQVLASGSELIFLTPCTIGTHTSDLITDDYLRSLAESMCTPESTAVVDAYMDGARALCGEMGVRVCDCYANWKLMEAAGVDVTALLANDINHPTRLLHKMFAYELVKMMLSQ